MALSTRRMMKVYRPEAKGRIQTEICQPGLEVPDCADFFDSQLIQGEIRKIPKTFKIVFRNGVAEVDQQMGQYLIDHQRAQRSPLLVSARGA